MNTKLTYLYTDGGGHRYFAERTFAGTPEDDLLDRLRDALESGGDEGTYRFIAEQVGLPSVSPGRPIRPVPRRRDSVRSTIRPGTSSTSATTTTSSRASW